MTIPRIEYSWSFKVLFNDLSKKETSLQLQEIMNIGKLTADISLGRLQGIGIKGKEMALVWHEKASRTALQTSTLN